MTAAKIIQLAVGILVVLAAGIGIYIVAHMKYTGPRTLPTSDMDEFEKTDPALVKYRELDPIKTGLPKVRGIAVGPDDRIYVCGDSAIRVLGPAGKDIKTIEVGSGLHALAVAGDGTIYVATTDHVQVVAPDGKVAAWPGAGEKAIFTSVAVAGEHVYVADAGNLVVWEYDKAGKVTSTIGRPDPEKGVEGFVAPSPHLDVAVGRGHHALGPGKADRARLDDHLFKAGRGRAHTEDHFHEPVGGRGGPRMTLAVPAVPVLPEGGGAGLEHRPPAVADVVPQVSVAAGVRQGAVHEVHEEGLGQNHVVLLVEGGGIRAAEFG